MTEISLKSTKQDILDAYEGILKKYEDIKINSLFKGIDEGAKQAKPINKKEDIFGEIISIKTNFIKELETVETKLREKFEQLSKIEGDIDSQKKYLEEILGIKAKAESLYALIDIQNKKEQDFEELMTSKKRELKKTEDDWKFTFEQSKQKETYEWEIKKEETKRKFDQEIQRKISELNQKEEDLKSKIEENKKLVLENQRLQNELNNISPKLETQITEKIEGDYKRKEILLLKDFELKEKMLEIENKNLLSKIEEIQKQNIAIQKSLDNSMQKVEQLASKVVESSRPVFYERSGTERENKA